MPPLASLEFIYFFHSELKTPHYDIFLNLKVRGFKLISDWLMMAGTGEADAKKIVRSLCHFKGF